MRFYYDLASHLHMTVGDMLSRMSSAELTTWAGYFKILAWERK